MKKTGWSSVSRHQRGYGTEWNKLRLQVLRRDNGLCQCSQCKGGELRVTVATEVDHIMSKINARALGWSEARIEDMSNLQAINSVCHAHKTLEEQGKPVKPRVRIGLDGFPVA